MELSPVASRFVRLYEVIELEAQGLRQWFFCPEREAVSAKFPGTEPVEDLIPNKGNDLPTGFLEEGQAHLGSCPVAPVVTPIDVPKLHSVAVLYREAPQMGKRDEVQEDAVLVHLVVDSGPLAEFEKISRLHLKPRENFLRKPEVSRLFIEFSEVTSEARIASSKNRLGRRKFPLPFELRPQFPVVPGGHKIWKKRKRKDRNCRDCFDSPPFRFVAIGLNLSPPPFSRKPLLSGNKKLPFLLSEKEEPYFWSDHNEKDLFQLVLIVPRLSSRISGDTTLIRTTPVEPGTFGNGTEWPFF